MNSLVHLVLDFCLNQTRKSNLLFLLLLLRNWLEFFMLGLNIIELGQSINVTLIYLSVLNI